MINCLALGLRLLATRIELLILPMALSIIVLLLPPVDLSVYMESMDVLIQQFQIQSETLDGAGLAADPQSASMLAAALEELDVSRLYVGELVSVFGRTFFRMPTYIFGAAAQGLGATPAFAVTSLFQVLGLTLLLVLVGAVSGAFYLYWLARFIPRHNPEDGMDTIILDEGQEFNSEDQLATLTQCIGQGMLYVGVLIALWIGTAFALSLVLAVLGLVTGAGGLLANLLPFFMTLLTVGLILFVFYQTYVTAGIMMDGLSVWSSLKQSVQLVRRNVFSTLAFLMLGGFILLGVQQLLDLLVTAMEEHWAGMLVAAAVFAYVGTAITMAFLVFYRTRYLKIRGYDIAEYFAIQDN